MGWWIVYYSDDDGSTYVLVNSDLSTKLIKYDSNMEYVWKNMIMPLVIDRSSLVTYYVGTIMVHPDDRNVFVLSTIERADAKGNSSYAHQIMIIISILMIMYCNSMVHQSRFAIC